MSTDLDTEELDTEDEVEFIPATSEGKPEHCATDISSKSFWAKTSEQREELFGKLRAEEPVSWQRPVEDAVTPDPDDPGYWAAVRHADILRVSRDNDTFISGQGVLFDMLPPIFLEMTQSFLAMDPPKHDNLRKVISSAFTPKRVRRIEDDIRAAAKWVVDGFAHEPSGEIEFVERCARQMPQKIFCDMFGIPEQLRTAAVDAAADIVAWADPEALGGRPADEVQIEAATTLHDISQELVDLKRAKPGDDLMTNLVQAEVDGRKLDDFEIGAFFVLMSVAGTDTTRHTSSLTVKAMTEYPEQRDWLRADYENRAKTAIEEFVRFSSPVMTFRRTAVKETELGGKKIVPGDKVVMFYPSGNRDADVFANPEKFDLSRDPNPHVGFGGGGTHFCLGNQIAKSSLRALFHELLTRIPDFEAGEPDLLGTNFMRGVKRMPFRFTPEK